MAGKNYFLYPLPSAPAGRDIMEQKTGGNLCLCLKLPVLTAESLWCFHQLIISIRKSECRPEMIQKVRDGEAFVSICGHCGKKSHMDYSFLYYQPSALFLVYYAADQEDYEKAWKMLTGQDRERCLDEEKLRGVKKRLVTSREALREKLMILDGGFDGGGL